MTIAALAKTRSEIGAANSRPFWRLLREDLGCVAVRDLAARNVVETPLTYPGVHALIRRRFAPRLRRRGFRFPSRFLSWFGQAVSDVDIHPGATIGRRFFIDHGACVVIGDTAVVGNEVTLYHGVTLGGVACEPGKRHPTLEDGVLVGCGAKILGPITIGSGSRIGANSVVIEDALPGVTVVGILGRVVRDARGRRRLAGTASISSIASCRISSATQSGLCWIASNVSRRDWRICMARSRAARHTPAVAERLNHFRGRMCHE